VPWGRKFMGAIHRIEKERYAVKLPSTPGRLSQPRTWAKMLLPPGRSAGGGGTGDPSPELIRQGISSTETALLQYPATVYPATVLLRHIVGAGLGRRESEL
jgi:hypothetical protein